MEPLTSDKLYERSKQIESSRNAMSEECEDVPLLRREIKLLRLELATLKDTLASREDELQRRDETIQKYKRQLADKSGEGRRSSFARRASLGARGSLQSVLKSSTGSPVEPSDESGAFVVGRRQSVIEAAEDDFPDDLNLISYSITDGSSDDDDSNESLDSLSREELIARLKAMSSPFSNGSPP